MQELDEKFESHKDWHCYDSGTVHDVFRAYRHPGPYHNPTSLEAMSAEAKSSLGSDYGLPAPIRNLVIVYADAEEDSVHNLDNHTVNYARSKKLQNSNLVKPSWHSALELRNRYDKTIRSNTDPAMHKEIFEVVLDTKELRGITVEDEQLVVRAIAKAMLKIPVRISSPGTHTKPSTLRETLASWFLGDPVKEPPYDELAARKQALLGKFITEYSNVVKLRNPQELEYMELHKRQQLRKRFVNHAAFMVAAAKHPNLSVRNWPAGGSAEAGYQPQVAED